MNKEHAKDIKLKAVKFCILNDYLYWKDPRGVLLNCFLENEAKAKIQEFHKEDCWGYLYCKFTAHTILRVGLLLAYIILKCL